jgi:DnaK suppressor protein
MPRKVMTPPNSKNTSKAPAKAAKTPAKTASAAAKSTGASKAAAKSTTKAAAKPPAKSTAASKSKPRDDRAAFLASQRQLLLDERANYIRSADALKAQADSLALEHEPGDVQFDEEGGEGGTSNVDRELDLVLSAQARAAAAEIDRALAKIQAGTYGLCEQCGQPIPDARLQALPQAALCVACKSGGLSSRR